MDKDKLKQWMDIADQFQGNDFWNGVFGNDYTKQLFEQISSSSPHPGWQSFNGQGQANEQKGKGTRSSTFPRIDIYKNEFEMIILIELAGIRKEDIQLGVSNDLLQVKGTVNPLVANMDEVSIERSYGAFERTIRLPEQASEQQITAKFINGLLKISFPRTQRKMENINIE